MNKKIVLPLTLAAAGVIAYFLIKKKDTIAPAEVLPPAPEPTPTPTPSNPLGNSQMVKNFQIYYNRVRPIPYANLVVDGIYGPLTKAAYLEFKDRYINFLNTGGQFTNYILGLSENHKFYNNQVYIEFLNKDKGFKKDIKKFNSYEKAVKWGKKNFDMFSFDMIKYK